MPPETAQNQSEESVRKTLDALTPERAEEVASTIAEQWQRDWGAILRLVQAKTEMSRSDTFQFMMLREIAMMRGALQDALAKGIQPKYHDDCKGCLQEKQFHELQWEALQLTIRHLKDELGEDWKDKE